MLSHKNLPLLWPHGWKRTEKHQILASNSILTCTQSIGRILHQLNKFGASNIQVTTNLYTGNYIRDYAVAVYWDVQNTHYCIAIDVFTKVAANLNSVATVLSSIKSAARAGGSEVGDRMLAAFVINQ